MDKQAIHFQRRAVIGDRHFVLANPEQPDLWALAGTVVQSTDKQGVRHFGPAKTISTAALRAWAQTRQLPFHIEENFPVFHSDLEESLAA